MEYLNVLVAAIASYVLGAVWYMVLAKPWMAATGIKADANGRPESGMGPLTYLLAFLAALMVAGMMRHMYAMANIITLTKGLISGLGIGFFVASPWIMINNAFGGRPFKLTLIDGGYASFGCGLIGLVLTLF